MNQEKVRSRKSSDNFKVSPEMHEAVQSTQELHKILCFKDSKSNTYGPPFTVQTLAMFVRDLGEELVRGQAAWAKHPNDFSIFELGEYDVRTGSIRLHDSKNLLGLVNDYRPVQ